MKINLNHNYLNSISYNYNNFKIELSVLLNNKLTKKRSTLRLNIR